MLNLLIALPNFAVSALSLTLYDYLEPHGSYAPLVLLSWLPTILSLELRGVPMLWPSTLLGTGLVKLCLIDLPQSQWLSYADFVHCIAHSPCLLELSLWAVSCMHIPSSVCVPLVLRSVTKLSISADMRMTVHLHLFLQLCGLCVFLPSLTSTWNSIVPLLSMPFLGTLICIMSGPFCLQPTPTACMPCPLYL